MDDPQIIELYWARSEQAISETSAKYGTFLWRIARNILESHDDADECVNDTYLRAWNAIPPSRPSAFRAWLGRITRNLSLDRWNQSRAQKRGGSSMDVLLGELSECVPAPGRTEQHLEDQALADALNAFLGTLSRESRVIFLRRYWCGDRLEVIAAGMNCSAGKVKSSLFRTRSKLRAYLQKEGIEL